MNSFSCMFQSGKSRKELFHHEKGPERKTRNKAQTRAELAAQVDEAMKKHPDPYEVTREKPGYTKITGPTLILGDEASSGLRMGIDRNEEGKVDLGAGRIWSSHRKEIAAEGQTAAGFKEKIKKNLGFRIKTYSNAILQIGKHDLLGGKSAKEVFKEIKEIWTLCDQHKMKVYACTIPPFGGNKEQEAERVKLNQLILDSPEADQLVFGVIDLEHKMNNLNTNVKDVYVEGKHRKAVAETDKDKMTVAYLEALMGGGRDSLKVAEQSPMFSHPPQKTSYVMLGDSYAEGNESYLGGKKSPGQYIKTPTLDPETEKAIPRVPGENTSKMFDRLETEVIPMLTKVAGYRCAVIQAGAEDIMRPLQSDGDMTRTETAIIGNLKRMYKRCLESQPPVMVVACTLPPMTEHIEAMYPGEENKGARKRHYELWKRINDFVVRETYRLSQHPKDRYKRIMCVRINDLVGTRKGYIREKYLSGSGEISPEGRRMIATQIHHAINQMQVGIDFGKYVFTRPKLNQKGEPMRNEKGDIIFETIWRGPDYLLDENDYEPGSWKLVDKKALK